MKSVVEADFSFRKLFTVKSAYIQNIARSLRPAYTEYQTSVARFPFDRLSAATRRSFEDLTKSVDEIMERGVLTAEIHALNYIWMADPNTGIRGPKTPSEVHLGYSLRMSINLTQYVIGVSDDECLEEFAPLIVPSFQPYTDAIVAAANDQIPNINDEHFRMSQQGKRESLEATAKFIDVINACGASPVTEVCIKNFVIF